MDRVSPRRDDRGSALVVVLVAVAFLTILGSLLLFTTYTGYQMKMMERRSNDNFYSAEAALNEVRIGIQKAASDAIAVAYTDILEHYNTSLAEESEAAFQEHFVDALFRWTNAAGNPLLKRVTLASSTYDLEVLRQFLSHDDAVTLSSVGAPTVIEREDAIVLKGLQVSYVDDGYETTLSTDLTIGKPGFTYTLSDLILNAIQDYTIIAGGTLRPVFSENKPILVDGNAYAGSILVDGGTLQARDRANYFICANDLTVRNNGAFSTEEGSKLRLWTGGIALDTNGRLDLDCYTYVRDDLSVTGNGVTARLAGQYFGFGSSGDDAAASSAILLSGRGTKLDMSELKRLVLAGNSFIDTGSADVMMGESLSVRSNQLAYLIPISCFSAGEVTSNPYLTFNRNLRDESGALNNTRLEELAGLVNMDAVLWADELVNGQPATLSHYISDVQLLVESLPTGVSDSGNRQVLVYFYMQFRSKKLANDYFRAYFAHNTAQLQDYLSHYADEIKLGGLTGKTSVGALVGYEGGDSTITYNYAAAKESVLRQMRSNEGKFENLCATLSTEVSGSAPGDSVYDYLVDEDAFNAARGSQDVLLFAHPEAELPNATDSVWAAMVSGNAHYGVQGDGVDLSDYKNLKIIIATGNITASKELTGGAGTEDDGGLVIAGGDVITYCDLTRNQEYVSAALKSVLQNTFGAEHPTTLLDLLQNIGTQSSGVATGVPARDSWDLEKLVTYSNWSKN